MAKEIERKFLVTEKTWQHEVRRSIEIRQGYLANTSLSSIRIRIAGHSAQVNIKSASLSVSREEYEYNLPLKDAEEMLTMLCPDGEIAKTRHHVRYADKLWEIDEFHGVNAGLIIAEVELKQEDERFEKPPWVGREVSHLARYYNPSLLTKPFNSWDEDERQGM